MMLWQEIRARGYPGGYPSVRDCRARFRGNARIPAPALSPPNPRTVTAWFTTRPGAPDPAGKDTLEATVASPGN